MSHFVMTVGVSGSGKSSICKEIVEKYPEYLWLSSDDIRGSVFNDVNDQAHNNQVFDIMQQRTKQALTSNRSVLYDATNLSEKYRLAILSIVKKCGARAICLIMATPIEVCIERDAHRDRSVGKDVIWKQVTRFQCPQYYEGWDEINIISDHCIKGDILEYFLPMVGKNQNNPHHRFDLGTHCYNVFKRAVADDLPHYAIRAALFHDIGKLFTESVDDSGISHYLNHANVSTYFAMTHEGIFRYAVPDEVLNGLFVINNHMKIRDVLRNESTIKKYQQRWGQDKFDLMVKFMRGDDEEH